MYREQSDISLDDLPNVKNWIERLESRKSWQDAFAPLLAMFGG
jgi:glutathione S-transferase